MADFYGRLQGTASRLLKQFKQGEVVYVQPGTTTGPAFNPVVGAPTNYQLNATVSGVSAVYVDETLILATDLQVITSVFDAEPTLDGTLTIDDKSLQIVKIDQIPAAGTVLAWRIFVRA